MKQFKMGTILDSLKYPLENKKELLIIYSLFIFLGFVNFYCIHIFKINHIILAFATLMLDIFIFVFLLRIIRKSMKEKEIKRLYFWGSLVQGIKAMIVKFYYFIIPIFIVMLYDYADGYGLNSISKFISLFTLVLKQSSRLYGTFNIFNFGSMLMNYSLISMSILIIILFILFDGLSVMALGKLVETNSLKEALNFKLNSLKLKELGLKNYLLYYLEFLIVSFIFMIISGFIGLIPFIGFFLVGFIITPYYFMFKYREFALIYREE